MSTLHLRNLHPALPAHQSTYQHTPESRRNFCTPQKKTKPTNFAPQRKSYRHVYQADQEMYDLKAKLARLDL